MKTKKVSRVLALLLSLVMFLGALPTAFAESSVVTSEADYEAMAQAAAEKLYARLMGSIKYTDMQVELGDIVDEQLNNIMLRMTEEERAAYEEYVTKLYVRAVTQDVSKAGPFLPAVDVSAQNTSVSTYGLLRSGTMTTDASDGTMVADVSENGLELRKTITPGTNGQYTVRLDIWTTGTVSTTTTTTPVDIVLVLDQSNSMKETKLSDGTYYYKALYSAVDQFINGTYKEDGTTRNEDGVKHKYSTKSDHRIAIVTFNNTGSGKHTEVVQDWTEANGSFSTVLNGLNNGSYISSGTRSDLGMKLAVDLMDAESYVASSLDSVTNSNGYDKTSGTRQKVVIMFSDGVPSTSGKTNYDTDYADDAIGYSKALKDAGCTVYSIGIFEDANPYEVYGDETEKTTNVRPVGSSITSYAVAGNRYLNYLSTNSSDATDDGLKEASNGWTIEKNFSWSNSGYYLDAATTEQLVKVFKSISSNITTPSISLGTETIIRDIVTPTFAIPGTTETEQIAGIKYYTQEYDGTQFVGELTEIETGMTADITENSTDGSTTVDMTINGFNFNDNCISATDKNSHTTNTDDADFGRKLIIEFTIKTKAGFLGGNNIPTNGENSGVYQNEDALNGSALENFPMNYVNMPVIKPVVSLTDKYVYLMDDVSFEQMYPYDSTKPGDATNCIIVYDTYNNPITLDISQANGGLAEWQTKYADLTIDLSTKSDYDDLTEDKTFTAEVTIDVDTSTLATIGTAAGDQSDEASAKIYVFKPQLTFSDYLVDYQSEIDETSYSYTADSTTNYTYFGQNLQSKNGTAVDPTWVNDGGQTYVENNMLYDEPTLALTFDPTNDTNRVSGGKVIATDYVPVQVTVAIGGTDVTSYTKFVHNTCTVDDDCKVEETGTWAEYGDDDGSPAFLLHVRNVNGDLTITKTVNWNGKYDEAQTFLFKVEGTKVDTTSINPIYVSITFSYTDGTTSSQTISIKDLPAGTYTVTELSSDGRYTVEPTTGVVGSLTVNGSVTPNAAFTNTLKNDKWLDAENSADNLFTTVTTTGSGT